MKTSEIRLLSTDEIKTKLGRRSERIDEPSFPDCYRATD